MGVSGRPESLIDSISKMIQEVQFNSPQLSGSNKSPYLARQ
jgi:hypothetical protein